MLAEIGGPLVYESGGRVHEIPAAALVSDEDLLAALRDVVAFAHLARVPKGVTVAKVEALRVRYCAISGLPATPGDADLLHASMVRYGEQIEADFARIYPAQDPITLWQARRWRRLDNLLVRLPRATLYREAMLNDPEMVRAMLERQQRETGTSGKKSGLSISEYTPEVSLLRDLINEERRTQAILIGVNSKGGKVPSIDPYPGPVTAIEDMEFQVRKERHDALTDRVLRRRVE